MNWEGDKQVFLIDLFFKLKYPKVDNIKIFGKYKFERILQSDGV